MSYVDPTGLCQITLEFSRVAANGYHISLYSTDSQGSSFVAGGPTRQADASSAPSAKKRDIYYPDPRGHLRGSYGPVDSVPSGRNTQIVYDDGAPCSCHNKSFGDTVDNMNANDIPYDPLNQNSNSPVGTMLQLRRSWISD